MKDENITMQNNENKKIELGKKALSVKNSIELKSGFQLPKAAKKRTSFLKRKLFDKPDFNEEVLDKQIINEFDFLKSNKEIYNILTILTQKYNLRDKKDKELIFQFLTKIKMQEVIKTDLLESNYNWNELYPFIEPYIFGKTYNFYDTLFNYGDESELLYVILHGKVSRYTLVEFTRSVSCEEYLLFLCSSYLKYHQQLKDGETGNNTKENNKKDKSKNKQNKKKDKKKANNDTTDEEKEEDKLELKDDEYIDDYLLHHIVEKNKEIYPLHSFDDIGKLNVIIFKLKLLNVLSEGKSSDGIDLFEKYRFPITFLGYDKVIERQMTIQLFLQKLYKNLGTKGRYYNKQLGLIPQQVKLLKFVKKNSVTPYNFFGNFEIIDCAPKRKYTVRCESDKCVFICIDKKMYSSVLFDKQRTQRENEINLFHSSYLFKNININYFTTKIFSHFKISNLFKGDTVFEQDKKINHFTLVKDGIIEIALNNISFFELNQIIKKVRDLLIFSAKRYSIDFKELLDFNMEIDSKTTLKYNIIKEVLHRKQNFIFSRSQKGFFGEYELFFYIPSLMTGTVISDICKVYYYDFDEYKNLNEETYILNESLKHNSFFKLKTILKRMINVYNSYWKRCHDILNKAEIENEKIINIKNNEEFELNQKKSVKSLESITPTKVNPNLRDIFISHTTNNSTELNIAKEDDIDNFIKLYLNKSNKIFNNKLFRTSLDYVKSRYNYNSNQKNKANNLFAIKGGHNFEKKFELKTLNNYNEKEKEHTYKKSFDHIRKKINTSLLLKEYKNILDAQRALGKKVRKKIFLPPILQVPEKLYKYPIFKTEVYKSINNLENNNYDFDNSFNNSINKSVDKSINKSINKSLNKSQNGSLNGSMNKSVINNSRSKLLKSRNKIQKIKTLNLKVAQFNVMRYRIEQIRKRNPKLYMTNASYSK